MPKNLVAFIAKQNKNKGAFNISSHHWVGNLGKHFGMASHIVDIYNDTLEAEKHHLGDVVCFSA